MYKRFEVVHNGGIYKAVLCGECYGVMLYHLQVYYDWDGYNVLEFQNSYKTLAGAKNKLKKYFKGDTVEWREIE